MNLADLTLLQDIARHGSFAAVARLRNVDPSSIGRMVAGIEAELGVRLFERSTRRMALTEAGARYIERVTPLTDELERAAEEARATGGAPRGTLRISASVTFGQEIITPRLAAFRARYPQIEVEGVFTDATLDLVAERIDLAIRLAPTIEGDYVVSKLMDTIYRVVASPAYLRDAPPLATAEDLARHSAILFPYRDYRARWKFRDAGGRTHEQPVTGALTLTPAGAIRDAALAGLGPALLPHWLVDADIAAGRLVHCLADHAVTATEFDTAAWLVYPSRSYLPAKTRAMIDFLRDDLRGAKRPTTT